jgi:hypothetical protein
MFGGYSVLASVYLREWFTIYIQFTIKFILFKYLSREIKFDSIQLPIL